MKSTNAYKSLAIITFITLGLWVTSIPSLPQNSQNPIRMASQVLGNLTTVYMAISLVLSMRTRLIDKLFGGLDQSYKLHAFVGSLGFLFMIGHPLLLVLYALPDPDRALFYLIPGPRLAANLGITAVYLSIFAFTFMTFLKIPYNHWLNTHRVLGISFLLGAAHAYLAPSYLLRSPLLSLWLGLWIFAGLTGAVYSIILYRKYGPKYPYKIEFLEKAGDIFNVTMRAIKQQIDFIPGQFVYVRFHNSIVGAELHPFSPSSAPTESTLRLSIKGLGDYTNTIDDVLKVGEKAEVYGPFGSFSKEYVHGTDDLVWIGGGIGITPFLSMIHAERIRPTNKNILFYYSLNKEEEAVFDKEIATISKETPNIKYVKWIADKEGFLTFEKIMQQWSDLGHQNIPKILLCGPPGMMHALHTQALKANFQEENIIFEEFSFLN